MDLPMVNGRSQLDDIKDDRVSDIVVTGERLPKDVNVSEVDELEAMVVSATASTGRVEISEILMCAKCIGECKIF